VRGKSNNNNTLRTSLRQVRPEFANNLFAKQEAIQEAYKVLEAEHSTRNGLILNFGSPKAITDEQWDNFVDSDFIQRFAPEQVIPRLDLDRQYADNMGFHLFAAWLYCQANQSPVDPIERTTHKWDLQPQWQSNLNQVWQQLTLVVGHAGNQIPSGWSYSNGHPKPNVRHQPYFWGVAPSDQLVLIKYQTEINAVENMPNLLIKDLKMLAKEREKAKLWMGDVLDVQTFAAGRIFSGQTPVEAFANNDNQLYIDIWTDDIFPKLLEISSEFKPLIQSFDRQYEPKLLDWKNQRYLPRPSCRV
jgi:hypothetical protein